MTGQELFMFVSDSFYRRELLCQNAGSHFHQPDCFSCLPTVLPTVYGGTVPHWSRLSVENSVGNSPTKQQQYIS